MIYNIVALFVIALGIDEINKGIKHIPWSFNDFNQVIESATYLTILAAKSVGWL